MRILLVEDHRDSREVMRRVLVRDNHDVTAVSTLADAVRICVNGNSHLVICNIGLPDGDGWEMAKVARECGCSAIATTAYGMPDEIVKAKSAGFTELLFKPFVMDDLLAAVARADFER